MSHPIPDLVTRLRRRRAVRAAPAALAALLALGGTAAADSPPMASGDDARGALVTSAGQGEVRAQPDRATVTLGVTARRPTLDAARREANRVTEALLAVARGLGIPDAQVRSTRVDVNPEYSWSDAKRSREFQGYVVQRQLIVDLTEIDKLGALLEKGITAGANVVQEPVLDSSRRKDLEREALARALEDARRNAEVLAKGVGMRVGNARSVTGNGASSPPMPVPMMARAMAAPAAAEAPQTYQTGELVFSATANATWELLPAR
jgi:uncharacterized protein YggE